jgi:hypothetical protein
MALVWLQDSAGAQQASEQTSEQASGTAAVQQADRHASSNPLAETAVALTAIRDALRGEQPARRSKLEVALDYGLPVLIPALCFAGLAALAWAWSWCLQLFPRSGTLVTFEDLSAHQDERADKSRLLTQAILNLLRNPTSFDHVRLQMDIMPGSDESGFGGLQPAMTMVSVPDYERSDRPMKIASIEFSLRDLVAFLSRSFSRPHRRYLEGWLAERGGIVEAGARLLDHKRRVIHDLPHQPQAQTPNERPERGDRSAARAQDVRDCLEWRVRGSEAYSREEAIADLAAQILVDTKKVLDLTTNWRSYRSFQEAMKLRQDQQHEPRSKDDLAAARAHLERAVAYDPANWIARFSLALTLFRDDESAVALKHLETLEEVIGRAWSVSRETDNRRWEQQCACMGPAFLSIVHHLEQYPACAFLVLYNKALVLASTGSAGIASNIFTQISRLHGTGNPALGHPYHEIAQSLAPWARTELKLYALSAQATLLADTGSRLPAPAGLNANDSLEDQIETLRRLAEDLCPRQQEEHWRSLQTARAVIRMARARVLVAKRRIEEAREQLEIAVAAEPRFVEAFLQLAELFLKEQGALEIDWALRAESWLKRALEISPSCQRAQSLRSDLYALAAKAA